ASRSIHVHPRPVPALDYAYESHDDEYDNDDGGTAGETGRTTTAATSRVPREAPPGPVPSARGRRRREGAGSAAVGGSAPAAEAGGGPFKCPKCGSPGEFFSRTTTPSLLVETFFLRRTEESHAKLPDN
ncbi:hypothetical protein THAOC_17861, partial [Thalassiosira oceanica]